MAFTEPSKPSTLPPIPLVTFCMIFEIRKRIAREDQSGTGHAGAEALCREWGIRLRFLAPPPPPRLLFFEATDGALGWIGGSPSPAVEVRSPSAEEAPPSPPSPPVEVSSPANIVVMQQDAAAAADLDSTPLAPPAEQNFTWHVLPEPLSLARGGVAVAEVRVNQRQAQEEWR